MIPTIHKGLTVEKWNRLPMEKRILNIVSELVRAKANLSKAEGDYLRLSLERVLELMDLTTDTWHSERSFSWLREFLRLRETIASFYVLGLSAEISDMTNTLRAFLDMEPSCHNMGIEV